MGRLITPAGKVQISIDGIKVPYEMKELGQINGRKFPLLGRYHLQVRYVPDGMEHTISCSVEPEIPSIRNTDSGENLLIRNFYTQNRYKVSIGLHGEAEYDRDGKRHSYFDYDDIWVKNGVAYSLLGFTKTEVYRFAVAWIDDVGYDDPYNPDNDKDVETWFGADLFYD